MVKIEVNVTRVNEKKKLLSHFIGKRPSLG